MVWNRTDVPRLVISSVHIAAVGVGTERINTATTLPTETVTLLIQPCALNHLGRLASARKTQTRTFSKHTKGTKKPWRLLLLHWGRLCHERLQRVCPLAGFLLAASSISSLYYLLPMWMHHMLEAKLHSAFQFPQAGAHTWLHLLGWVLKIRQMKGDGISWVFIQTAFQCKLTPSYVML